MTQAFNNLQKEVSYLTSYVKGSEEHESLRHLIKSVQEKQSDLVARQYQVEARITKHETIVYTIMGVLTVANLVISVFKGVW